MGDDELKSILVFFHNEPTEVGEHKASQKLVLVGGAVCATIDNKEGGGIGNVMEIDGQCSSRSRETPKCSYEFYPCAGSSVFFHYRCQRSQSEQEKQKS